MNPMWQRRISSHLEFYSEKLIAQINKLKVEINVVATAVNVFTIISEKELTPALF